MKNLLAGRLNRKSFIIFFLIIAILVCTLLFGQSSHYYRLITADHAFNPLPIIILTLLGFLPLLLISIKRLHDMNKSGWYSLCVLIPYLNILFLLILAVSPGTKGTNAYGIEPASKLSLFA